MDTCRFSSSSGLSASDEAAGVPLASSPYRIRYVDSAWVDYCCSYNQILLHHSCISISVNSNSSEALAEFARSLKDPIAIPPAPMMVHSICKTGPSLPCFVLVSSGIRLFLVGETMSKASAHTSSQWVGEDSSADCWLHRGSIRGSMPRYR